MKAWWLSRWRRGVYLVSEGKDHAAQNADESVEQVEDLLRGPAVLGHSLLDAHELHEGNYCNDAVACEASTSFSTCLCT